MIKIEITDLRTERPQDLVKLATFLLDFAGHGVREVPEAIFRQPIQPQGFHDKAAERFNDLLKNPTVLTIDELPQQGHGAPIPKPQSFEVLGVEQSYNPCVETYENPPYKHCAESDLTTAILEDSQGNQFEVRAPLNLGHIFKGEDAELPEHSHEAVRAQDFLDKFVKPVADQLRKEIEEDHYKNATQELVDQVLPPPVVASKHIDEPIVAEKPKRKRTPSKPKAEECKIQITKVSETDEEETFIVTDFAEIPAPPIETIAPPPPVNGNTIMDKILNALNDQKLTRDEITAIVVKHGLKATRDIFTNDHLIPAIDADIDEALRGK